MNQKNGDETQSLQRLKRVSDGIFMLAMTLMVLQFDLPNVEAEMSTREIKEFLIAQLPALYIYLGTFILIAFYWFSNLQQFTHYKKTDTVHLWLNLLSLMFVVLIPYTKDFINVYSLNPYVQIFYSINLFLVGLFSSLSWCYASRNNSLIDPNLEKKESVKIGIKRLIEPLVSLFSTIISLINPTYWKWSFSLFFLCP
ncbi:TMEM175 family protein [Crocosphaera sp.]|uniref:TMEM175 family protein n=1 Tax=Crocosphaera sp. TaxID=2729996 RepID=UPI002606978B|nr:TMEM175 family protein [Crocosphaera sp.]MDJ0581285.1 TMEM175 family protein [Crocosphaera sp.]